eukprot:06178.XXX_189127_190460_1 [CDS] Oithona nana genome sequencing.
MRLLLAIICFFVPYILALQDDTFINGYYYQDTINAMEDPEKVPNLASYSCSSLCMNHSTCGGFTVQSTIGCLYLEDTDIAKLVKSSKSGTKSREVWVKESKLNGLTPHLLVIGGSGKLQDISLDSQASPPIEYGIDVPTNGLQQGPFVTYHDLSILMVKPGTKDFLSWNFDDRTPTIESGINVPEIMTRSASTSQNGRIFFMRHTKSYTIVNNQLKELRDFGYKMSQGCAAFVPGDDDTVYLIGGDDEHSNTLKKFVYKYQFSANDYTDLQKDIPVNGGIMSHTCVGVEGSNGEKVVLVIGGKAGPNRDSTEGSLDTVRIFNVETNQWGLWPTYPLPSTFHRAIFANGHIYSAAGLDSEDKYIKKIFKMLPSSDGSWEDFADLDEDMEQPYLIMYNN